MGVRTAPHPFSLGLTVIISIGDSSCRLKGVDFRLLSSGKSFSAMATRKNKFATWVLIRLFAFLLGLMTVGDRRSGNVEKQAAFYRFL